MSGLNNLEKRLHYAGGKRQQDRMNNDKVRSLRKALLYSYQAATAILNDGREFRCLINPSKVQENYDDKEISIPFKDINVNDVKTGIKTLEGIETIGVKPGDTFEWKENGTHWLIHLQNLEEIAYFRAGLKRCDYQVDIDGIPYWVYVKGPEEETISWTHRNSIFWNNLNYTLEMKLTKDEHTEKFLHRFTKIKFNNKMWEVQAVDSISAIGIISIYLKEYYSNMAEEARMDEERNDNNLSTPSSLIEGPEKVKPYDSVTYLVRDIKNGTWSVDSNKVDILYQDDSQVNINIITGRSGHFTLTYMNSENSITKEIIIESL